MSLLLPPLINPEPVPTQWMDARNVALSILRLDKIHPLVSGNKWLKLSGWVAAANRSYYNGLMTQGGPWSNHVHAAAAYCHSKGWRFHAIIKGNEQVMTPMLQDVINWGGSIAWVHKKAFYQCEQWMEIARQEGLQWVPMGGDGVAGAAGVAAYFDLLAPSYSFDEIWCAVGTGTTLQGIAASKLQAPKVVGFNPGIRDEQLEKKIAECTTSLPRQLLLVQAPGSRFGKITPTLLQSMNQWWQHTGIPTDVVYTGKMLQYWQEANTKTLENDTHQSVLLVHTGGLQGNRSLGSDALKFTGGL